MTNTEYKEARRKLGYDVTSWKEKLGISQSTHGKYTTGHLAVSRQVGNHILTLLSINKGEVIWSG